MKKLISLLRGINVSGQKLILMKDLKALYESLGFENAVTYIQSGNVYFETALGAKAAAKRIEDGIHDRFGFEVSVVVRTPAELKKVVAGNPFIKDGEQIAKKLYVSFLSGKPTKDAIREIESADFEGDEIRVVGNDAYLRYHAGAGRTKLTNALIERKLGVATTRNWNTIGKLIELASASGGE
ncbi:MAG: DUF1697 domain-containing protein [Planctomycetes bacterium]|nr:DUF1697 domain-containing protein [Planctomycetota bacterium]